MSYTKAQLISLVRDVIQDDDWEELSVLDYINQCLWEVAGGRIEVNGVEYEFDLETLKTKDTVVLGTTDTVVAKDDATSITLTSDAISGADAAARLANCYLVRAKKVDEDAYTTVTVTAVSAATPAVLTITSLGGSSLNIQYECFYAPVPTARYVSLPSDYLRNLFFCSSNTVDDRIEIFKSFIKFIDKDPTQDDSGNVNRVFAQDTSKLWFGPCPSDQDTLTLWYVKKPTPLAEIVLDVSSIAVARPRVGEKITGGTSTATGYILWYNATNAQIGLERITGTFQGETVTGATSSFTATAAAQSTPPADEILIQDVIPESLEKPLLVNYAANQILLEKGEEDLRRVVENKLVNALASLQRGIGSPDQEPTYITDSGEYNSSW